MTTKATQENMVVHYQQKLTKCRTLGWCNVVAYQQKIMWLFVCRSIALSVTPRTPEKGCRENSDATTYWWNWLDPAVLGRRCQYSASIDTGLMMLCPVWQDSTHTNLVDAQLHAVMRLISGTVRSTPLPWLPLLANIEPSALRRITATDKLLNQVELHPNWPLHDYTIVHPLTAT